ncbi:26S proteasome regulatory subunit rpn-1 [Trichodelitschia bisporula]|uniref:26S proteasome regulatory subunit RPN1 n=1 Tax=Trichodelitschia bisporula TaxID=703511 RepID=A0A6G1HKY4_9PEZI|nr:26S proteasome regulatory subunit rpn-1 [Trichodelitschia bisporula]
MPSREEGSKAPPSAQDKGKAKVDDLADVTKEGEKSKDGKDAKADLPPEELSEEDQKLKEELEMLVERLLESDTSLYKPALEAIKTFIKTSTSSMTAVPKPLKFLRPHYEKLEAAYESWPEGEDKASLADMLSVLGMTYSDQNRHDTLKYRLLSPSKDIGSWGHEYMRHLALEIGDEQQLRLEDEKSTKGVEDLKQLALSLIPFFLKHNAEADAVDLLSELEMIDKISEFLDEDTYPRVCLYMVSMVALLPYPDNHEFLKTAYSIYRQYDQYTQALLLAIRLNDLDLIKQTFFDSTKDKTILRQMAFLLARERIQLALPEALTDDDSELQGCLDNSKQSEFFKYLAKELNILEPKTPEDIYKTHLENMRTAGLTNTDSARHNLSSSFVNAFVNYGFGDDKLMLVEDKASSWVWKTKDEGMLSTAASVGMLMAWDVEMGLDKIDPFTYADEDAVKCGALLATGILSSGVRNDAEPALALLGDAEKLHEGSPNQRVASIMGLGLAYAGSARDEVLEILLPVVMDKSQEMRVSAMAALSLGLVFVGTANSDVLGAIFETLIDEDRQRQLDDKWTRFMSLGLALLYFGQQEEVDVLVETLKAIDHPMAKATQVLAEACAWAGTGQVLNLQNFLHICNEHIDEDDDKATKKGDELLQAYAVLGLSLVAMGEDIGQEMILRQFGHLMHYGEANIRRAVPLAMGLISPSNPQMKVYDTLSRYSHDNDIDVAVNAIFAMGLLGAGTNNARLAQLLRQLASYYHRDANALFMVRIAQGLLHMGKGTLSVNPFNTDRAVLSRVGAAGLLTVLVALIDAKDFVLKDSHYMLYFLAAAMHPRWLITLDEDLQPLTVNVRVGQAVDTVGAAGRPKTITGWQTQSTPVLLSHGERAELEDEQYVPVSNTLEGLVILRKNPEWES